MEKRKEGMRGVEEKHKKDDKIEGEKKKRKKRNKKKKLKRKDFCRENVKINKIDKKRYE